MPDFVVRVQIDPVPIVDTGPFQVRPYSAEEQISNTAVLEPISTTPFSNPPEIVRRMNTCEGCTGGGGGGGEPERPTSGIVWP